MIDIMTDRDNDVNSFVSLLTVKKLGDRSAVRAAQPKDGRSGSARNEFPSLAL